MHRKQWIFDMDGTLTDSMTVVWQGAPLELLRRYGREARPGIHDVLLSMGMVEGAEYLIHTYDLPRHAAGHPGPVSKGRAEARRPGDAGPAEGRGGADVHLLQYMG